MIPKLILGMVTASVSARNNEGHGQWQDVGHTEQWNCKEQIVTCNCWTVVQCPVKYHALFDDISGGCNFDNSSRHQSIGVCQQAKLMDDANSNRGCNPAGGLNHNGEYWQCWAEPQDGHAA
jgi:hypothetical protein